MLTVYSAERITNSSTELFESTSTVRFILVKQLQDRWSSKDMEYL